MDDQYDIQIDGLTRREFIQAGSEFIRRIALPLFALVAVVTAVIAMAIGDFSLRSLLPPFLVAIAALVVLRLSVVFSWRKFPADTRFSYLIDREGWQITVGDTSANVDWQDTARMTVRSHVVLLFNEDNRSNLLPRRCLTPEQLEQMRLWYRQSRSEYKARRKEKEQQFRRDYRMRRLEEKSNRRGFRRR